MSTAAITVGALSKSFGFGAAGNVLDAVDLTVRAGTLVLISGAAGTGKSTLIRCLTGMYRPDAGRVNLQLDGSHVDLGAADPRTVAWIRSRYIAPFDGPLAAAPRVPTAVAVARAARHSRAAAVGALTRLQVPDLAPVPLGRLRTADRRTVALAAALSAERPFVLLDEPEESADPAVLGAWLRHLMECGAAVIATAAPNSSLESIATVVGELRKGRIEWSKR